MIKKRTLKNLAAVDFRQATQKKSFNLDLFAEVAPVYDRVTPKLSFGRDRAWKACLVEWLPAANTMPNGAVCVDLACGTGDFCQLLEERFSGNAIFGLDQSAAMMSKGQDKFAQSSKVQFLQGDMSQIPLAGEMVDIVTGGYAIRNAPELSATLAEVARVLKPGGVVAILDFSKSASSTVQRLQLAALSFWGKLWGLVYHGNPEVYGYLARSLSHFPDHRALELALSGLNLKTIRQQTKMFGLIRLLLLQKTAN